MYLNKAFIIGNLTRDPELKALPSGMKVASFSLATNRTWKDGNGEKNEQAEFHNIVVFGTQAETCVKYLSKGDSALVEGRIQTRSWEKDSQRMYKTEIVAENIQFGAKSDRKQNVKENKSSSEEMDYITSDGTDIRDIPF